MKFQKAAVLAMVASAVAACEIERQTPLEPDNRTAASTSGMTQSVSQAEVPDRAEDHGNRWLAMSDAELWTYIIKYDTLLNVGLKAPGARRGIWRNDLLVGASSQANGRRAIEVIPGIEIIKQLEGLPVIQIKVDAEATVSRLRGLPFIDYVEPNALEGSFHASGCGYNSYVPANPENSFASDTIPPHLLRMDTQIAMAWNRARGDGVALGLTDTGISGTQGHLVNAFDDGHSAGRWKYFLGVLGRDWRDGCSHGTRMAGVMAAPMNGGSMVGVAWRSHLVSANQADGVVAVSGDAASAAIQLAASSTPDGEVAPTRRIVTMAWQSNGSNVISDVIRFWYAEGRLFVGASGSVDYAGIAYPADMSEVIAVSAVNAADYSEINGSRCQLRRQCRAFLPGGTAHQWGGHPRSGQPGRKFGRDGRRFRYSGARLVSVSQRNPPPDSPASP